MRRFGLTLALATAGSALGFWAPNHIEINQQIWTDGKPFDEPGFMRGKRRIATVNEYLRDVLYLKPGAPTEAIKSYSAGNRITWGVSFKEAAVAPGSDKPNDLPDDVQPLVTWNSLAGKWEDGFPDMTAATQWGGRRAVNHFHNPLSLEGGYSGLTEDRLATGLPYIDLLRGGISAASWAEGETSGGPLGQNDWSYPAALDSMLRMYTEPDLKKRQAGLAGAVRAIGQVEHLIADNAVPDHARDLPHPGNGFEEYVRDLVHSKKGRNLFLKSDAQNWTKVPLKVVVEGGLRALWDRDLYTTSPESTLSGTTPGLAEYTNANFFAWNLYPGDPVPFTTIPGLPGEGVWTLTGLKRTQFPWPRLGAQTGSYFASEPGSLPLDPVAKSGIAFNSLDNKCWAQYAEPLMARAHGYAQTALTLLLPPARAEVVPSRTAGIPEVSVRLWNLTPPASMHAVTWTLDRVTLKAVRPDDAAVTSPAVNAEIEVPGAALAQLAAGQVWESPSFTLTLDEQFSLTHSSHVVVLVRAHLGTQTRTPIAFGVPIPNLFPLVQQSETVDLALPSSNNQSACCVGSCSACGESAVLRQSFRQKVSGVIRRLPTELDIFGAPHTDAALKAATNEDARIAGVAVMGYPAMNADLTKPTRPASTTLTLVGSKLKAVSGSPSFWIREFDAKDEADPDEFAFEATVDVNDFITPGAGDLMDSLRASGSIYLVVWTTAGAVHFQKLLLWPMLSSKLAATAIVGKECDLDHSRPLTVDDSGGCISYASLSGGTCQGTYSGWQRGTVSADLGYSTFNVGDVQQTNRLMAYDGAFLPTSVAAIPVATDNGISAHTCVSEVLNWDRRDTTFACVFAGSLTAFTSKRFSGTGPCPTFPSRPNLPLTATYERLWRGEEFLIQKVLGRAALPPAYTVTMH